PPILDFHSPPLEFSWVPCHGFTTRRRLRQPSPDALESVAETVLQPRLSRLGGDSARFLRSSVLCGQTISVRAFHPQFAERRSNQTFRRVPRYRRQHPRRVATESFSDGGPGTHHLKTR